MLLECNEWIQRYTDDHYDEEIQDRFFDRIQTKVVWTLPPIVLSISERNSSLENRSAIEDLPTEAEPNKTVFNWNTPAGSCAISLFDKENKNQHI
jgi:hypothetical protein